MKKILLFFRPVKVWFQKIGVWFQKQLDKFTETKIGNWLATDTKWAWLIFGLIIGFWSDTFYCACFAGGIGVVAYTCFYRTEWKQKFSFLVVGLMIALSMAGYGLAYILTEQ